MENFLIVRPFFAKSHSFEISVGCPVLKVNETDRRCCNDVLRERVRDENLMKQIIYVRVLIACM